MFTRSWLMPFMLMGELTRTRRQPARGAGDMGAVGVLTDLLAAGWSFGL